MSALTAHPPPHTQSLTGTPRASRGSLAGGGGACVPPAEHRALRGCPVHTARPPHAARRRLPWSKRTGLQMPPRGRCLWTSSAGLNLMEVPPVTSEPSLLCSRATRRLCRPGQVTSSVHVEGERWTCVQSLINGCCVWTPRLASNPRTSNLYEN